MKETHKDIPILFHLQKQNWALATGKDGQNCAKEHLRDVPAPWQAGVGLGDLLEEQKGRGSVLQKQQQKAKPSKNPNKTPAS